ncbi:glycosyltransferase [uncultured Prevotella sp.]|uniref:glycosyltransferase n=1 Tax=uncultured Prevotella sp. TaxID=159272 RepID=UPI0027E32D6F|nr:group 2 glycosyl transferase [uncultured Prevotella sp.]
MIIDNLSIIACLIIVLLTATSLFANPFVRKIQNEGEADPRLVDEQHLPNVTVLVLANNNAQALDAHLPLLLTQDYPAAYEVVVVGEQGDLNVETVVKQFSQNKHLYATYIPPRSLFMSKKKLAVALGVKAAHYDWVLLLDSNCHPASDTWLKSMASHMDIDANLVIGYSNYDEETKSYYRFDRLRNDCYLLRCAQRSIAYRANGVNIAFRKSEFIKDDGYRGNLHLVNGEYDFIVNKYARTDSARIAIDEDAWIREEKPTPKVWHDRNICYANVRKYLERSFGIRALYNVDMTMMHLNYIVLVLAIVAASILQNWIVLAVASLALILTLVLRSMAAVKVYSQFGEHIACWKTVFFELYIVWHSLATNIRYAKSDKRDFSTHKL